MYTEEKFQKIEKKAKFLFSNQWKKILILILIELSIAFLLWNVYNFQRTQKGKNGMKVVAVSDFILHLVSKL